MDVEAVSLMSSCHTHPMQNLNMSDHLPITACLMYMLSGSVLGAQWISLGCSVDQSCNVSRQLRVDWAQAHRSGLLEVFVAEVQAGLAPLLNNVYENAEQLDEEVVLVVRMLVDAAEQQLALVQPQRPRRWRDDTFSCLCAQSRAACSAWKQACCPGGGPLFEEKNRHDEL